MVVDKDNNLVGLVDLGIGERGETTNYLLIICNEQEINTNGLNYKYNYISDFLDSVGISGNAQDKYFA
ncbi:hypothetical protein FACS189459_0130 [Bacilli bacterium]|nr:hypothetical protein FACS189459_0130 [Bacilli bacterium]